MDKSPAAEDAPEPEVREVSPERHDLRILQALRRIIRSIELYSRKLALAHGITAPQLVCLVQLVERGPISLKALAAEVHLSPATMVGIVDRLEGKGLARRERSKVDRRSVFVSATESGRALALAAPSPLQDTLAGALEQLPDLERVAIALSLERVVELMEIERVDAAPLLHTGITVEPSPHHAEFPTLETTETHD